MSFEEFRESIMANGLKRILMCCVCYNGQWAREDRILPTGMEHQSGTILTLGPILTSYTVA